MLSSCTGGDPPPADGREEVPLWVSDTAEPYPFTTPIPPLDPTAIDGIYARRVTARLAGGPSVKCRRCAPYRIETGITELAFRAGRYAIAHRGPGPDPSRFQSRGHFTLADGTIRLFNDGECPRMEGVYRWDLSDGVLTLDVVEDDCPFSQLRQRFLQLTPWVVES